MNWEWFLGVPIITAAALALIPLLIPTFRWSRQLGRDVQLWKDMPAGEEKDLLEGWINDQATRLREYREFIPLHDKVLGWAQFVLFTFLIIAVSSDFRGAVEGVALIFPSAPLWSNVILGALFIAGPGVLMVIAVTSMPRGRSFYGQTPAYFRDRDAARQAQLEGTTIDESVTDTHQR